MAEPAPRSLWRHRDGRKHLTIEVEWIATTINNRRWVYCKRIAPGHRDHLKTTVARLSDFEDGTYAPVSVGAGERKEHG